jgi:hypothetical protein
LHGRAAAAGILLLAAALALLVAGCSVATLAFQENLPAHTPESGTVSGRFGYIHAWYGNRYGSTSSWYLTMGGRTSQDVDPLVFEEGLTCFLADGFIPGLSLGAGLRNPPVMARIYYSPLAIYGLGTFLIDPDLWWQASLLAGSGRSATGLGWALGGHFAKLGYGPTAIVEYGWSGLIARLEGSYTMPQPWVREYSIGSTLSAGISLENNQSSDEP